MKYVIDYYWMDYGAHMFSTPTYQTSEYVNCENNEVLQSYIESQKDAYGGSYEKSEDRFMGFDYISNQGGVKVREYEEIKIETPNFKTI